MSINISRSCWIFKNLYGFQSEFLCYRFLSLEIAQIYCCFIILFMLKVWKYQSTEKIADSAMDQIHIDIHTAEGQTEANVLITGGVNGSLRYN